MLWQHAIGRAVLAGLLLAVGLAGCGGDPPVTRSGAAFIPSVKAVPAPTYTIAIKAFADPGKSVEHRQQHKQSQVRRILDAEGKALQTISNSHHEDLVFTDTVVEKGDAQPTKFKRFYTLAKEKVGEEETTFPFEGRTLVFEFKDGIYEAKAEGQPALPASAIDAITKRITRQDHRESLLPKEPVKVGDTWVIDIPKYARMLPQGTQLDLPNSKGSVKLVRIDDSTGQMIGVMELTLNLSVQKMFGLEFKPTPGKFEMKGKLETAIAAGSTAGSLEIAGQFAGKAPFLMDGKAGFMDITLELTGKEVRSPQK